MFQVSDEQVRMYYGSSSGTGGRCTYLLSRRYVHLPDDSTSQWNDVMATILHVWHHFSYHKSDSQTVNRCVFTWRTIVPNFIRIQFETTEP